VTAGARGRRGYAARLFGPFRSAEARRLATMFAVVYFAQGMWSLPHQAIYFVLKERFGYTATRVATLMSITMIPWLIKPVYGLTSDLVPLFGRRRKSYFLLSTSFAALAGLVLAAVPEYTPPAIAVLFGIMGLGLAFTDVLVDALMVEHGRHLGLTGGFQAVQWAAIYTAAIAVGIGGGRLAERGSLRLGFLLAALFPLVSFVVGLRVIREPRRARVAGQFAAAWAAIRGSIGSRELWLVAGLILAWTFTPSLGTALYYYETNTLGFSQQLIGNLAALSACGAVVGALAYGGLSRILPLRRLLNLSIGLGVISNLVYLGYRSPTSAVVIDASTGIVSMIAMLAFLDLAARACPKRAESTFFALLMSVYNAGTQGGQIVGGWIYESVGYGSLIWIGAAATALCWVILPFVPIGRADRPADLAFAAGPATPAA